MLKRDKFYTTEQKISQIYLDILALYLTSNFASLVQRAMAVREMCGKSGNCSVKQLVEFSSA